MLDVSLSALAERDLDLLQEIGGEGRDGVGVLLAALAADVGLHALDVLVAVVGQPRGVLEAEGVLKEVSGATEEEARQIHRRAILLGAAVPGLDAALGSRRRGDEVLLEAPDGLTNGDHGAT